MALIEENHPMSDLVSELPTSPSAGDKFRITVSDARSGTHQSLNLEVGTITPRRALSQAGLSVAANSVVYLIDGGGNMRMSTNLDEHIDISVDHYSFILSRADFRTRFEFDDQKFESHFRFVSGLELMRIVGKTLDQVDIWCEWHGEKEKTRILGKTIIDLLDDSLKCICGHKPPQSSLTIFVNGRSRTVNSGEICFEDLLRLAFDQVDSRDQITQTVTYFRGPADAREGSLIEGQCVPVTEGMVFNVTQTDKS